MASANILLRSWSRMPSASASEANAPGLMPKMKRPLARWSNMAACEASSVGCECDKLDVPLPSLMVLVSGIKVARNNRLLVTFSALSVRCSPTNAS